MGVRACVCVKQGIESIIFVVKTAHTHTVTYVHYTCASNIVQHNLLASQTFPRSLFTFLCIAATRSLSLSACCSLLLPLVLPAFFCLSQHKHRAREQRRPQHRTRSLSSDAAQHVGEGKSSAVFEPQRK